MDVVSPVVKLIISLLADEYSLIHGISDKLRAWKEKLPAIQSVLESAEEKQMYDGDPATVLWLADLRDLAYDMEDLLEEFSVDAKRDACKAQSSKLPRRLVACFSRFRPRALISGHRMASEIEDVDRRLDQVLSRVLALQLVRGLRSGASGDQPRFRTTSLPEPKFVGREKQMEELLARLTGSEPIHGSVRPFSIVSIVGMGGLGKTTLAQELYNRVNYADFTVKAWACVSEVFDVTAITKSILDQVAPSSSGVEKDLNQLQNSLKENLSGKKFLLVLDDVWNEKYEELEFLLRPLYSGSKGSRVLLTTRNLEVARLVGDSRPKQLDWLSLEECLYLLAYHSIGKKSFEQHPHLRDIAVQLAKKCKGLPLSIKTIGGLLRFEIDDEKWKEVLAHGIWDRENGGGIPPALKLSYSHLPVPLKRCFAACALFPKDYLFYPDEVIQLWIIHGLLERGTAKTYREVGMKYLHRLEAASLLQKVGDGKIRYSMHDLVNDLAKSIDVYSYWSSDEYKEGYSPHESSLGKVRHAAIVTRRYDSFISKRFNGYRTMRKLRTFMPFRIEEDRRPNVYVAQDVIHDFVMSMKNLRVLSLRFFQIREVPDRIGELKLLRSIEFSYTEIELLPESICDLVELRSLLLRGCKMLKELPRNIHKLPNLLHLDITDTDNLKEMPQCIDELTNLEILGRFVVGKEAGQGLKKLGPLKCLQRDLQLSNLLDVNDVEDAKIASLSEKEALLKLSLDWGSSTETSRGDDFHFKLLEHLQPPRKIKTFVVRCYRGKRFPSWFGNPYNMNSVVSITLAGCGSVDLLPPLGRLPLLKWLNISGLGAVSSIGPEFYGSERPYFRSLRSLNFADMGAWEKWSSPGDDEADLPFPRLQELKVIGCPRLNEGCTLILPTVVKIHIDGCDGLLKCLAGLTSMTKKTLRNMSRQVQFEGSFSNSWTALEDLSITNCLRFKSFIDGNGKEQAPPKLNKLEISGCRDLEKLPDPFSGLTSLNEMRVDRCDKLSSFPSEGLPPALRKLTLDSCSRLPMSQIISSGLPESLEELSLENLEGLVSITELAAVAAPLSRSMCKLYIRGCRSLTTLPDSFQHLSSLSELALMDCPELEEECFPDLPCNLSSFTLERCPKVKSLPHDMHRLTSLKELKIHQCEGITRFPELPCNLSSFQLRECRKVKSLPPDMHRLTSLQELSIRYCNGITSLPRGGLPPNLERLWIEGCWKLNQPIGEWGLRGLTTLQGLRIMGRMECVNDMECFPPDGDWHRLLPPSLVFLTIRKMEKLETIASGFRAHLTSFQSLRIDNAPRLRQLPDDGLPDSLEWLYVRGCPLLKEKCSKPKGEYWPHLRLIPRLDILD